MPDLATIIAQQAELVSAQQLLVAKAVVRVATADGGSKPERAMQHDAFINLSKSLTSAIDKYATLLYAERDRGLRPR